MVQQQEFIDRYGRSIGIIFVALLATLLPVVGLIRIIPVFKEAVLGALVVVVFTSHEDWGQGAKHALVSGMIAAVAFNVVAIPASVLLGGLLGGAEAAATNAALSGLGVLSNVIGLVFFSPVGYLAGGAVGGLLN